MLYTKMHLLPIISLGLPEDSAPSELNRTCILFSLIQDDKAKEHRTLGATYTIVPKVRDHIT